MVLGTESSEEPRGEAPVSSSRVVAAPVSEVFSSFPTREVWETMNIVASTLKAGGVMPRGIDTVQKMVVVLQAGREMGLAPIEALNSFYFVNGKVTMYGEAVPNQILRAGHTIEWGKCTDKEATVTITRGDTGKSMTTKLTWEQAESRKYITDVWRKFPENMLKWRALSMTAKFICPDALRGIGIKEDMEAEVVVPDSRFHNAEESERVQGEVKDGTYSKRPSLKEAIAADKDATV